jgi:predicted permease
VNRPLDCRLLRRLVAALTPADDRHDLLADLDEDTRRRLARDGAGAAWRWQRRQLWRSIAPMAARRLTRARPAPMITGVTQDGRLAVRSLARAPLFTVSVVVMLGLAIGSHTVIFAVADAMLLRPLPFGARSPRLLTLHSIHPTLAEDWDDAEMSYLDLQDFKRESTSLDRLEGVINRNVSISTGSETQRVLAASVTPGLFSMLGVAPLSGRDFIESDGAPPGFEHGLIISHALWHSLTAGDPRIVGRTLLLNGRQVPVLGVMPEGFAFPEGNQLWLPYRAEDAVRRDQRGLLAIALLRPEVTLEAGTAELKAIASRLAVQHPETNRGWSVHTIPFRQFFVSGGGVNQLLGGVTLLLLAACANIAGLIVTRGLGRQRELTVRAALGSGRLRLVRLLLIENAVLALLGGVAGLLFAGWGITALLAWIPEPPPYWAMPSLDARVALFAVALTATVTMLTGLFPAMRIARVDASGALLPGARATAQRFPDRRLQHALVIGQLALSFALLVGGVLLGRSATALLDADGGFQGESLLSLRFYLAGDRYDPLPARAEAVNEIVRRVAAIPGVRGAAATGAIPTDDGGGAIRLRVPLNSTSADDELGAQLIPVSPGFWDTLGLPIAEGRTFTTAESIDPQIDVVAVNRRLAARLWPGQSAVDRVLDVVSDGGEIVSLRVIGVVPDLVYEEFGETTAQSQLNVYVPVGRVGWRTQALLVNTELDPAGLASAVRAAFRRVDPGIAVFDVLTMGERRAFNHWGERFIGRTFSTFAVAALVLACVGAYAIAAGMVAQRRREIGVRLALGAARGDIRKLFLGSCTRLAALGIAVGAPLAWLAARLLERDLFRVSIWERDVWLLLPLSLLAAVIGATYFPARRASHVDPAIALREG